MRQTETQYREFSLEPLHHVQEAEIYRFLSLASHELKTPITTIRAYAQLLLHGLSKQSERSVDPAALRSTIGKIVEQTGRLNTLVDDLLDPGNILTRKMKLCPVWCDLGEVCLAVVEDQRLLTGRLIELTVPATPVLLEADSDRLSQVVINLVSNAVKYSPEDCAVQVHVSQHDGEALIQVCDAGRGIPLDQRTRIFEAFYRAPTAQGSLKQGLGLGLTICKEIVEWHGGRIWCESCEGKGTTFVVALPSRFPSTL